MDTDFTSHHAVSNVRLIRTKDCDEVARKIGAFAYQECSAKLNHGVKEVFDMAFGAIFHRSKLQKVMVI